MPDDHANNTPTTKPGRNGNHPPMATRWKKGQSANPKGRPRGITSITGRLREIVEQDDGKAGKALAKAALRAALEGDYRFWKEIVDRLDGPIRQEVESAMDGRIEIIHVKDPIPDDRAIEDQSATPDAGEGGNGVH